MEPPLRMDRFPKLFSTLDISDKALMDVQRENAKTIADIKCHCKQS